MLCEVTLLSMTFGQTDDLDVLPPWKNSYGLQRALSAGSAGPSPAVHRTSPEQIDHTDSRKTLCRQHRAHPSRQLSREIEIPAQAHSTGGDVPFLVPSFCQSICENYSDLHIGGDQVLPLLANEGELRVGADIKPVGPFLKSFDVPSAVDDSLPGQATRGGLLRPLTGGSSRWRQVSARDRSFLFQGREGPFSNSLLNRYLEQKLLDLYQQYMMENMARGHSDSGPVCPLLGSELVLTSVDQITMKLSREGNLEAGLAKDMVLSCLLRVAGEVHSSEISTPFLQISNESFKEETEE